MGVVSLFLQPEHTVVSVRLITEERGRQITFVNEMSRVKRNNHGTLGQLFQLSRILVPSIVSRTWVLGGMTGSRVVAGNKTAL